MQTFSSTGCSWPINPITAHEPLASILRMRMINQALIYGVKKLFGSPLCEGTREQLQQHVMAVGRKTKGSYIKFTSLKS